MILRQEYLTELNRGVFLPIFDEFSSALKIQFPVKTQGIFLLEEIKLRMKGIWTDPDRVFILLAREGYDFESGAWTRLDPTTMEEI